MLIVISRFSMLVVKILPFLLSVSVVRSWAEVDGGAVSLILLMLPRNHYDWADDGITPCAVALVP